MKLTDEQLEIGRNYLRQNDLDSLGRWIEKHRFLVPKEEVLKVFATLHRVGEIDKALKLFDAAFVNKDPQADERRAILTVVLFMFVAGVVLFGCLGGCLYLFSFK